MYFIAKEDSNQCQRRRKATGLAEAAMAIAGIPGQEDTLSDTAIATIAIAVMDIGPFIAIGAGRIEAWLCRNFPSYITADFALAIAIRTGQRIAFSSESPRTWFHRLTNLAATFRS